MAYDENEANKLNTLQADNFAFEMKEIPEMADFVVSATIPNITFGNAIIPTANLDYPIPGDKLEYDTFEVEFLVDEYLSIWKTLYKWMAMLAFPNTSEQFKRLKLGEFSFSEFVDIGMLMLTNKKNPAQRFKFIDCFPINLSPVQMTTNVGTSEVRTATTQFKFKYMAIEEFI